MKYKAIIEIGGYKVGQEVPADKAELWLSMYKIAPVKIFEEPVKLEEMIQPEPVKEFVKPELEIKEEPKPKKRLTRRKPLSL